MGTYQILLARDRVRRNGARCQLNIRDMDKVRRERPSEPHIKDC